MIASGGLKLIVFILHTTDAYLNIMKKLEKKMAEYAFRNCVSNEIFSDVEADVQPSPTNTGVWLELK